MVQLLNYIKWGFESRLKLLLIEGQKMVHYIKWGFESRLKLGKLKLTHRHYYIKWGFESRLKLYLMITKIHIIISNGDLRVD